MLVDLARTPQVAPYLVTTAPDVATSTNLAGFINRTGVFAPTEQRSWSEDPMLQWAEGPPGQHIELGISEMNLFLLLGQLGLSWDLSGQPLLPVGTVYDPFVCRGLDAFIYGTYSGSRFVVAGTPSGITLAPEGGAHQSTITASVGPGTARGDLRRAGVRGRLDWLLCDALGRIAGGAAPAATAAPAEDGAYYFRLQHPPARPGAVRGGPGPDRRRGAAPAGGGRGVPAGGRAQAYPHLADAPVVQLAASGAVLPEVLAAAAELAEEGIAAHVVDVTSLDRLYRAWQRGAAPGRADGDRAERARRAAVGLRRPGAGGHRARRGLARDGLARLGARRAGVPLGVDEFGQSGTVRELYELHDLLPGSIVNAALAALSLR